MSRAPRILIVDNDTAAAALLEQELREAGIFDVHAIPHGIEAQRSVARLRPTLIVVTIDKLATRALELVHFSRIAVPGARIVCQAAHASPALLVQALRAGANDVLESPASWAVLGAALREGQSGPLPAHGGSGGRTTGTVLAVVGQKGGIGKTTLSTNLATALATRTEASTIIVDLDLRFGDVSIMLDIHADETVAEAAAEAQAMTREALEASAVRHESGLWVLGSPASRDMQQDIAPAAIATLIERLTAAFDYVVLDTPGAMNGVVAAAMSRAHHIVALTSMERSSAKNTALLLGYLRRQGVDSRRVSVVANHTHPGSIIHAAGIEALVGAPVAWEIPHDRTVALSCQAGTPIVLAHPASRAARSFTGLAGYLTGDDVADEQPRPHPAALLHNLKRMLRASQQVLVGA